MRNASYCNDDEDHFVHILYQYRLDDTKKNSW